MAGSNTLVNSSLKILFYITGLLWRPLMSGLFSFSAIFSLQRNPYSSFSLSCKGKDNFPKGPHLVRWESQEKCLLFIQETYPLVKTPNPLFLLSLVPYYHISSPLAQEYFHWLAWIFTHVGRVQKLSPKIFGEPNSLVQGTYIPPLGGRRMPSLRYIP